MRAYGEATHTIFLVFTPGRLTRTEIVHMIYHTQGIPLCPFHLFRYTITYIFKCKRCACPPVFPNPNLRYGKIVQNKYRRGNQKWTNQETGNIGYTRRRKIKIKTTQYVLGTTLRKQTQIT